MEKKKCGPATVGPSLNDDLMAFARRVRISMLRGVGCSEFNSIYRIGLHSEPTKIFHVVLVSALINRPEIAESLKLLLRSLSR